MKYFIYLIDAVLSLLTFQRPVSWDLFRKELGMPQEKEKSISDQGEEGD